MSTGTATKTNRTVFASASVAAATPSRGAIDLRTTFGGLMTVKMTNGGTGPTVPLSAILMVAHDTGTLNATGAAGAVWKTIDKRTHVATASAVGEFVFEIPPSVMQAQIEFSGNTAQAVTAEALFSELTSISNV